VARCVGFIERAHYSMAIGHKRGAHRKILCGQLVDVEHKKNYCCRRRGTFCDGGNLAIHFIAIRYLPARITYLIGDALMMPLPIERIASNARHRRGNCDAPL